ncbi:MAG: SDR family oxidoreductase [Gammaproteobacteria bacterium]|nr:SDR family oxidoreductase [Gammaproteobacteria bacterium]
MNPICKNRVVAITGAGRGLGRAYAIAFAAAGARVVVNDLGTDVTGMGQADDVATKVVEEIRSAGGEAVADHSDITTTEGADHLVALALEHFGQLDVLVCNAGAYRVDWLWETTVEQWDQLMRVHLRGLFCPATRAIAHWRERAAGGETVDARLICITSQSGLFGAAGSAAYDTAKAGVAGFVIVAAKELEPLGVCVNGVAPRAQTRMSDVAAENFPRLGVSLPGDGSRSSSAGKTRRRAIPEDVAPLVVWLGSEASSGVTGRILTATAGRITLIENWANGPSIRTDDAFDAEELTPLVTGLIRQSS